MSKSCPTQAAIRELFDALSAEPSRALCTKCGSTMVHLDTFFMSGPSEEGVVDIVTRLCKV